MTGAATPIESTFSARARDMFLLKGAERAIRSFTPEQHAVVRKHFDAAQRRASVADDLSDDRNAAVAYVLYREAVSLLISAVIASRTPDETGVDGLQAREAFRRLHALASAGHIPPLPAFVGEAESVLSEDAQLAFDRRAPEDLLSRRKYVEQTLRWLSELIEARTLNEIRATRLIRLFIIAAIIVTTVAWGVSRAAKPANLALGKPVTVSSRYAQSTAPIDNSGIVNGDIEGTYGLHTNATAGVVQWAMVDLGAPASFGKIRIFNRADGAFDDQLPLTLELSDDGTNFTLVETRATSFSSRNPWVYAPPGGGKTRYVRVKGDKYVALTEVEVNP
ncbi:MAG: discoidin domain-containing protein [Polyangiaceae bacterium]